MSTSVTKRRAALEQTLEGIVSVDLMQRPTESRPAHSLFDQVSPNDEILLLAAAVSPHLSSCPAPRSLCELQLTDSDLDWLSRWASLVGPSRVEAWLSSPHRHPRYGFSGQEAFGLLFLLLASEVVRREGQEGAVWSVVAPRFLLASEVLFAQGQPRLALKLALEAAAECFDLHHAFGLEGTQAYYTTVFMQFGFTNSAIPQLTEWLQNRASRPVAVVRLLRQSPAFAAFWQGLEQGRLQISPFWLSEWEPALRNLPAPASSRIKPWLIWPGQDEPYFRLDLQELFPGLADGVYELTVQAETLWLNVGAHGYEPRYCFADGSSTSVCVSLETGAAHEFSLFDHEAYTVEGRPTLAIVGPPLLLLLPGQVEPQPAATRWHRLGDFKVHAFTQGLQAAHQFYEDGVLVRQLDETVVTDVPAPVLSFRHQLLCWLPHSIRVSAQLPADTQFVSAYVGGEKLEESNPLRITLPASTTSSELKVRFSLRHQGRVVQRTSSLALPLEASTYWDGEQWSRFEFLPELDASKAEKGLFRFLLDRDRFGLIEGDVFLGRPHQGARPLRALGGYGAPLRLMPGPYGVQDQLERQLAETVVNRGCLSGEFEADADHQRLDWNGCRAVVYRQQRLGADWSQFQVPTSVTNWHEFASMLRWLHLPLLQPQFLELLRPMLWEHGETVLKAWLMDRQFGELQHSDSEAWLSVVDAYFGEWRPTTWRGLIPVDSVLRASVRLAFRLVRDHKAVCTLEPPRALLGKAAMQMDVAPEYLLSLAQRFVQPLSTWPEDLPIALRHFRFQDYLLAQLMEIHGGNKR